tara:strand:- start:96 stop:452 length:357 start_codon:yes stop_codon:yes gene_type:complete
MIAYICDTSTGRTLFRGEIADKPQLLSAGHTVVTKPRPSEQHVWCDGDWVESADLQKEQIHLAFNEARRSAYPSTGDQLDLIYKALMDAPPGLRRNFRPWLKAVTAAKQSVPKPEELL